MSILRIFAVIIVLLAAGPMKAVAQIDARAQELFALNLYHAARSGGHDAMIAAGWVVLNRVQDPRFPDTIKGVITQGGDRPGCQFGWYCDGRGDEPKEAPWREAQMLTWAMLGAEPPADPTGGAVFQWESWRPMPHWGRDTLQATATIGGNAYFRARQSVATARRQTAPDGRFVMATGAAAGRAYTVGAALAALAGDKPQSPGQPSLAVIETKGYVDNIRKLQKNQAQLAVVQAMFNHFARTGTGTFEKEGARDDIRAIAQLWRDADHIVVSAARAPTGTIEDLLALSGDRAALGAQGPGPLDSNRLLLANLGYDMAATYDLDFLSYGDSATALQNGDIAAMSTPIRPPGAHIVETLEKAGDQVRILEFTDAELAKADGGLGLWTRYTIPAGTYPGQERDIATAGKSNLLVVRADADEDAVYRITKVIFENLATLHATNDAMREVSLESALLGPTIPLHAGALRFYKEVGRLEPDATADSVLSETLRSPTVVFASNGAATNRPPAELAAAR